MDLANKIYSVLIARCVGQGCENEFFLKRLTIPDSETFCFALLSGTRSLYSELIFHR